MSLVLYVFSHIFHYPTGVIVYSLQHTPLTESPLLFFQTNHLTKSFSLNHQITLFLEYLAAYVMLQPSPEIDTNLTLGPFHVFLLAIQLVPKDIHCLICHLILALFLGMLYFMNPPFHMIQIKPLLINPHIP